MVMDLYWGISLVDVDKDLSETIEGINEMSDLGNTGVKWMQVYENDPGLSSFGIVSMIDESKVNMESGLDLFIHDLSKELNDIFYNSAVEYCSKYSVELKEFETFHFTKNRPDSLERNYYDAAGVNFSKRVTFRYFINDNYEGGEITFPKYGISIKPKAGQLLMFPSSFMYNYIEKPILNGVKYQAVAWQ